MLSVSPLRCWQTRYHRCAPTRTPAPVQVIIPSFGERYLSSALFQSIREEAEAQTFEA